MRRTAITTLALLCTAFASPAWAQSFAITGTEGTKLNADVVANFNQPWAMTFLPDGSMLVTERKGKLFHVTQDGKKHKIKAVPSVAYGGQGGLGDVVLHPNYAKNSMVYLSHAKGKSGKFGAVVASAKLKLKKKGGGKLTAIETVWKQKPKTNGRGHYGHRIAFGPKGSPHDGMMFITSGDRQKQTPAQDFDSSLGKIVRLKTNGDIPKDNPWADGSKGKKARSFWSIGHRNMLGIAFASDGTLWSHEMGPRNGDELNVISKSKNYGWPIVSEGNHYSGRKIPDHNTRPEFEAPKAAWVPTIAPSGLVIYDGEVFKNWKGDALIGGLKSRALIHVSIDNKTAKETERFQWDKRIREVEQGPKGNVWVLEDSGRLVKLSPKS